MMMMNLAGKWLAGSRNDDDADDDSQQLSTFVVRPSLQ
jgi:hypothetical protein